MGAGPRRPARSHRRGVQGIRASARRHDARAALVDHRQALSVRIDYEDLLAACDDAVAGRMPLLVLAPEEHCWFCAWSALRVAGSGCRWSAGRLPGRVSPCMRRNHLVGRIAARCGNAHRADSALGPAARQGALRRAVARSPRRRDCTARRPFSACSRRGEVTLADDLPPRRFLPDTPAIFSSLLFRQRERWRDRVRYLSRTTSGAITARMRRLPLPDWLFPAFWIFVPLHDYALVPGWKFLRSLSRERA